MIKQRILLGILLLGTAFYFLSKPTPSNFYITGKTMGTTYSITAWGNVDTTETILTQKIDSKLKHINQVASTWIADSEISKFNGSSSTQPIKINKFFVDMLIASKKIHTQSGGAFDITIAPLINLWGFDATGRITKAPNTKKRLQVIQKTGSKYIHINTANSTVQKKRPDITVNLSAIAKGGGVDSISTLLKTLGFENYLVEIGGEIYAHGKKQDGTLWRVGIETPNSITGNISKIISLKNMALATSGDYRNYFEQNGVRYSHILNSKTGKPIGHKLASVSIVSKRSAIADGWATAMMVLGEKDGMEIAKKHNIAVLMLIRKNDGFKVIYSPKWTQELGE